MAKGKYLEWSGHPDKLKLLSGWARDGLTDEEIAKNIGISRSTLADWKNKFPDISDALKKGKEEADYEVEDSLFKRATGYTAKIKKTFKVKKVRYSETGRKIEELEELEQGEDEVHIPADVTAMIFWLKNRRPDKWKDRRIEIDLGEDEDARGIISMMEEETKRETERERNQGVKKET